MMPTAVGSTTQASVRRARTDAKLAQVITDHLERYGYAKLTIERVSAESKVAKTTIYRRWASKAEMVFDLVIHQPEKAEPPIDSGSLLGDLSALAERSVAMMTRRPGQDILPGLLADMAGHPELSARVREVFVNSARSDIATILDRAAEREGIGKSVDIDEFQATLLGVPYARLYLLAETDERRIVDQLTAQLLALIEPALGH